MQFVAKRLLGRVVSSHTKAGLAKSSPVSGARRKDMQRIFEDERRRNKPISANPYRTGHIFPPAALHSLDGAPALASRERAFLGEKICLRWIRAVDVNRP